MKKMLLLVSMFICIIGFSQSPKSVEKTDKYQKQEDTAVRKDWDRQEAEAKLRAEKVRQQDEERQKIEGYSPLNQPNMQQQQ
jgi:hypothetical protein